MKKFPIVIFLILNTIHSYGIVIIGTVKDLSENDLLPGVVISLGDSEAHTDLDGDFIIESSKDIKKMELKFPGYLNLVVQNIKNDCDTLHLGTVYMLAPTQTFHPPNHGIEEYYYEDGSLKESVPFKNEKLHGDYKLYSRSQDLLIQITFRKGLITKSWINNGGNNLEVDKKCQCLKVDLGKIKINCL